MSQPTDDPVWATDGLNTTEPSGAKQALGWVTNEVPPSSYMNWWMNRVWLWVSYLKTLASEAFTWTAAHIFNAQATFNGFAVFWDFATFNSRVDINQAFLDIDTNDGHITAAGPVILNGSVDINQANLDIGTSDGHITSTGTIKGATLRYSGVETIELFPCNASPVTQDLTEQATWWNAQQDVLACTGDNRICNIHIQGIVPGDQINSYGIGLTHANTGVGVTVQLIRYDPAVPSTTQLGSTQTSGATTAYQVISETLGAPHTVIAGSRYVLHLNSGTASLAAAFIRRAFITKSRP